MYLDGTNATKKASAKSAEGGRCENAYSGAAERGAPKCGSQRRLRIISVASPVGTSGSGSAADAMRITGSSSLRFGFIEMIAQDFIHKVGLSDVKSIGGTLDEHLVGVRNNEKFVFGRKGPRAHMAIQCASLTSIALDVIALLTKRLPVPKVIAAVSGARDFMVRAELNVRFLQSTVGAHVPVMPLQVGPLSLRQLRSWLAFLAHVKALQLIADALFFYRREPLFSLQFPHSAENAFIGVLSVIVTPSVNGYSDFLLRQRGTRYAVPWRPKRPEYDRVISFIGSARGNKIGFRICEPFLSPLFGFVRRLSRSEDQPLAGARLCHLVGAR